MGSLLSTLSVFTIKRLKIISALLSSSLSLTRKQPAATSLATPTALKVPPVDILTFTFEGKKDYDHGKKLYFEAEDDSLALTGPQVVANVKLLIAGLKAAGVEKGDCVCLHMFNNVPYTCLYFAIIGCGAAYTGTNPAHTVFELTQRFELCTPRVVVTVPEHLAAVQAACKEIPDSGIKIFVLDEEANKAIFNVKPDEVADTKLNSHSEALEAKNPPSVASLLTHGSSDWMRITDEKTARETTACLFSTSGTTGMPKLCKLSHHAEIAKNMSIQSEGKDYEVKALISVPLFHIFGAALIHMNAILNGDPVYVMARFDLKKYVTFIDKYGITDTATTPLMVLYLLKSGLPLKEMMSTLRYIWCGSAPIDASVLNRFYEVLTPKAIITGLWGMSETGGQTYFKFPERDTTGSVGRLAPGMEIRLVDDSGNDIKTENTPGEAWVRATQLMSGYYKNPEATEQTMNGEWLRSGDICYVSGGKWYVVGRKKELIKVSGWQVAPAELEAVLLCHPKIFDAAVVGVKTGDNEKPRAYLVRVPGVGNGDSEGGLGEEEVRAFMKERLAKYKSLDGGIVFVDAIPKNAMQKSQKHKLLEMYPYTPPKA